MQKKISKKKRNELFPDIDLKKIRLKTETSNKKQRKTTFDYSEVNNLLSPIKKGNEISSTKSVKKFNSEIINNKLDETELSMAIYDKKYENYPQGGSSSKSFGMIKSYGYNSYQGLFHDTNEDNLVVFQQINRPLNSSIKTWPKMSYFAIFDGHGGNGCSDFLKNNLLKFITEDENFPQNIKASLLSGFQKAEDEFYLSNFGKSLEEIDFSGSCALVAILVDTTLYIANTGDSRALLSRNGGKKISILTEDHKPTNPSEFERLFETGNKIYIDDGESDVKNNPLFINDLKKVDKKKIEEGELILRAYPSGLSVLRTIGDISSKHEDYGGNPEAIICTPEIYKYELNTTDDFIIMGCDGIYDDLSNVEVINSVWYAFEELSNKFKYDIHNLSKAACDMVIKTALEKLTGDNLTCIIITLHGIEKYLADKRSKDKIYSGIRNNKKKTSNKSKISVCP